MTDSSDLRTTLNQTDMTAPAIQSSSRAMMRYYDKPSGPTMAVTEWRSVLQTSSPSQSLPLLYVANEVLQTSKRNRGNKYLEAFSPVLGSSLQYICDRDRSIVEKVRRTVKIWGDRRVFSMRFVLDVLGGLEQYRGEGGAASSSSSPMPSAVSNSPSSPSPKKSPVAEQRRRSSFTATSNDSDDDDDDDMFGGGGDDGQKLLDISIDATALSSQQSKPAFGAGAKRRLSNSNSPNNSESKDNDGSSSTATSTAATASATTITKKPKTLSGSNFLSLFQSIVNLDEKYKSSIGYIESIPSTYLEEASDGSSNNADVEDLVGDELTDMYKRVCQAQRNVRRERRTMYSVAIQRKELEREAKRYVGWLKNLAKVDDDDIDFCDRLEKKLDMIAVCHEEARSLRDKRRAQEAQQRAQAEANAKRQAEEEERRRILDDAKMEAEAKPGTIWNKETREYEYVHDATEESWRD